MRRALLILTLLLATAPAVAEQLVLPKGTSEVAGGAIRLSDVFSGIDPALDREIALAPLPGKSVTYDSRVLAKLAAQYRLNWQPESVTDKSVITRASTLITADMIRAAIVDKLRAESIKGETEIQFDRREVELHLPASEQPAFTLDNFAYDSMARRFRADMVVGTFRQPLAGRVSIKRDLPVLAQPMQAGSVIGERDLVWLSLPEERIQNDMATSAGQLIGSELRRDVADGQVLRLRDVMPPKLVTRGSLVTLKVETSAMQVTAQGRAMEDGAKGDVIRITNTQSKRVIEGQVEGPGIVRIRIAEKMRTEG